MKRPRNTKQFNIYDIKEWDINESTLAVKVTSNLIDYLLPRTNKIRTRRYELFILRPDRPPVSVGWSNRIFQLLRTNLVTNYYINKDNELNVLRANLKPDEIILDWWTGMYYHNYNGEVFTDHIAEYYLEFRNVTPKGKERKVDRKIPDPDKQFKYTVS